MPQQVTERQSLTQFFSQDSFSGGINTAAPSDRLSDTECVDIQNFEYDSEDQLVSRSGVTKFLASASYSGRITSIHYYENDAGNVHVLYTNADKLYATDNVGSAPTDITGALTFPSDTFWQWRNFNGLAIGVNKATSGTNPVKVSGAGPTAAALAGTPPKAKYIEIWNNRVWLVGASEPNTIYGSALGDPEDWTTAGAAGTVVIDISKNDGDRITGIIAFRERLFIFKRTKIFVISATAAPVTDPDNLRVDIFTNNIGCVSAYSIQSVLDDVLFLSESGISSLASSEAVGDFTSALLSRNVKDIQQISNVSDEIPAHVIEVSDQYILGVPASLSFSDRADAFVLDYKQIQNRIVRWLRFDGKLSASAYGDIYVNGERQLLVGAIDTGTTYRLYKYVAKDTSILSDDNVEFTKSITTKAYNVNIPLYRKLYVRWGLTLQALQDELNFTVQYYLDQILTRTASYSFNLNPSLIGALWDDAVWDADVWDAGTQQYFRIWRPFQNNQFGRKAVNITFIITNNSAQAMILNNLQIEYSILSHRGARNV